MDADAFSTAYTTCIITSSTDDEANYLNEHFDGKPAEFDPETLKKINRDCAKFQQENADDIDDSAKAGHQFWLTRNHLGAGFWDNDKASQKVRDRLTKASHKYGECFVYVGDDGLLHI